MQPRTYAAKTATPPGVTYASYGMPWYYATATRPSGHTVHLEVYFRAVSGTVYARLMDITDTAAVSGSEISSALTNFQRRRTTGLILTDDHEYRVQLGKQGGDQGECEGARIQVIYP
jgi:hypothetical protein